MSKKVNPRGIARPQDGGGKGVGRPGGMRGGININPCPSGGVGYGQGGSKGKGKNR